MSSSLISSRSNTASISSSRSGVKCSRSIVARSLPEPLTHMTSTSRPTWSVAVPLADVLPPPKLATARSAPSRCEASRTCPSASSGTSPSRPAVLGARDHAGERRHRPQPPPPTRWCLARRRSARRTGAARRSGPRPRRASGASRRTAAARRSCRRRAAARGRRSTSPPRASASRSTSCAFACASCRLSTLSTIASTLASTLCAWSIVSRGSESPSSKKIRNSSNGLTEPTIRSSSAYLRLLKWKPPSRSSAREERDDLLDVRAVQVVAEVDQHLRPLAELLAGQQRRAPVGEVGRVERRLERLVLDQQLLLGGQRRIDLGQALEHPGAALARSSWPG